MNSKDLNFLTPTRPGFFKTQNLCLKRPLRAEKDLQMHTEFSQSFHFPSLIPNVVVVLFIFLFLFFFFVVVVVVVVVQQMGLFLTCLKKSQQ